MGINYHLTNFNRLVAQSPVQPIILNDMSGVTEQDRERIDMLTTSVYHQTDVFSNEPMCDCGRTKGAYNKGIVCTNCHTPVVEMFSRDLISRVWIRNPVGVAQLINPMVWNMLANKFTVSGFNLVEWLCNTDYSYTGTKPREIIEEMQGLGIQRGYNNFVNHFDEVIDKLYELRRYHKTKGDMLYLLLKMQRDCVFSDMLPMINKALLIREDTNVGSYIDEMMVSILDAIHLIRSIDTPTCGYNTRQKENRTIKAIVTMAKFYDDSYHSLFAKKTGMIRRHIAGTRGHWTCRNVISSNTGVHKYDELEIPWGSAIGLFTLHLKNKLFRLGHTPNSASELLYEYTNKYHPLIDSLLCELIAETPIKPETGQPRGFYCIFVRNPSLTKASTQRMRITKVKKDPSDQTISLSILSVVGFNADFDGDQMSLMLVPDNELADLMEPLAPHGSILDPNNPRSLTNVAKIPNPVASTISSWMKAPRPITDDPRKIAFLESLAH